MSAPDERYTRRAVLEGVVVAAVAGVSGFAWFTAAAPAGEDELDDLEDQLDDRQDDLEDEREDQQDDDEDS